MLTARGPSASPGCFSQPGALPSRQRGFREVCKSGLSPHAETRSQNECFAFEPEEEVSPPIPTALLSFTLKREVRMNSVVTWGVGADG